MAFSRGRRQSGANQNLLSADAYDDDASTLRNPSPPGNDDDEVILRGSSQEYEEEHRRMFDSMDDDELVVHHSEVSVNDRDVLDSEDEREKLLSERDGKGGIFGSLGRKKGRRVLVGSMRGEYEMEEGIPHYPTTKRKKGEMKVYDIDEIQSRRPTLCKIFVLIALLFVLLLMLVMGALRLTDNPMLPSKVVLSNGTHQFYPTTVLLSLDGFRADYLLRNLTPTLQSFIDTGVSPPYMLPSFPSVTFPNHYTIVTGLYPESHGIVGNEFWDPKLKKEFFYTDSKRSLQPYWWGGEPIWVTAEKQNVRAAIHMWPGSEARIANTDPTYLDHFNKSETLPGKVNRILGWLDMENKEKRPQFIASYVPHVDSDGHKYGPNSTQVNKTLGAVDGMLGQLFHGLEQRNLTNLVNIIVVSDHGMATSSNDRLIILDDLIDFNQIEHTEGWPLYGLRPHSHVNLSSLHESIVAKHKAEKDPHWDVYLRDVDMPARYHFANNDRIAPLWLIPQTGWALVTRAEHDPAKTTEPYKPRGIHGYDNLHPLMRSIFVARGPGFPHPPGQRVKPFGNWEVYSMMCHILGLKESPLGNNGTLGFGTQGGGFHFMEKEQIEDAGDLPATASNGPASVTKPASGTLTATMPTSANSKLFSQISEAKGVQVDEPTAAPKPERPVVKPADGKEDKTKEGATKEGSAKEGSKDGSSKTDGDDDGQEKNLNLTSWFDYVKWKAQRLKEIVTDAWKGAFGSKDNDKEKSD